MKALEVIKWASIVGVLSLGLTLGTAMFVHAGTPEPPTGAEQLKGPALLGKVILDGGNLQFIDGTCKGDPIGAINSPFPIEDLAALTKEDLLDYRISGGTELVPDCYKETGALIVQAVSQFTNTGATVVADVVLLSVVAK